ncbi:hypothetical protein CQ065_25610 [Pseudomonas sp. MYb187]|nr:hypothetical protein CQ065_25610 [Pseudomonas sp. MYb187]
MTLIPSPLGQMALSAKLCGPIARHFALRPSLRSVAAQIIEQQWRERGIKGPAPSTLTLYRRVPGQGWRLGSLADALIVRYCQASSLNLTAGVDLLSTDRASQTPSATDVDLYQVQTLLDECGPFLLDEYKRVLAEFWSYRGDRPNSPWGWLVNYLHNQFVTDCDLELSAGTLSAFEAVTAKAVAAFPEAAQRAQLDNMADVTVWLLNADATTTQALEPEWASALLIERAVPEQQRTMVLVYTLAGKLHRFESREALVNALRGSRHGAPVTLTLHKIAGPMFQAQVTMLFEQLLVLIERIAQATRGTDPDLPDLLMQYLDEATSLIDICAVNQRQTRLLYQRQLPLWLQQSSIADRHAYASGLVRLARAQRRGAGRSFLFDIPGILDYAKDAVRAAVLADHPQSARLNLEDFEVVNERVDAAAAGSGGNLYPVGSVTVVRLSLAQLALENRSALRAGSVTVQSRNGAPVPDWLTRGYLETLVSRLDLGKAYPDLLRQQLLDDASARAARQTLFVDQVREQLPLLALEKYLRKTDGITSRGVKLVQSICDVVPGHVALARMRPLAFRRRAGAKADVALNAYLIDARKSEGGPCVLYRSLHPQPLLEFTTEQGFCEALYDGGALQDDVLSRLDENARPLYARGGFEQPHIVRFTQGAEFSPIEVSAPSTLAEEALGENMLGQLYLSCARELVALAEAQSVSNSENRWIAYEELGWLMFNTLLPFFNGPVTVSAWMLQFFASLQSELQLPEAQEDGERLAVLLFNVASILFTFRNEPPLLKAPSRAPENNETLVPMRLVDDAVERAPSSPSAASLAGLDFSWSSARPGLTSAQRTALEPFKAELTLGRLGEALPHGPRQGLYLHADHLWASVDSNVYEVAITEDGTRIVDGQGQLGPWLRQQTPGVWAFDLGLRLRGGMPLNRRIEQMREANRQRVTALEHELAGLSIEREARIARLARNEAEFGFDKHPGEQHLRAYVDDIRHHCQQLIKADESFQALNQLKSQANFNRARASNLFELASAQIHLVRMLRLQFIDSVTRARTLPSVQEPPLQQAGGNGVAGRRERFVQASRHAKALIKEALASFEAIREVRRQLRGLLPTGPQNIAEIDEQLGRANSYRSWQSSEISLQGVLILEADQGEVWQLLDTVKSSRIALQMQATLEGDTSFTSQERVEVLDGSVRNFAVALEVARNYQAGPRSEAAKPLVEAYVHSLQRMLLEAEGELARHIRVLSSESEPAQPRANSRHAVIKTRNRGGVVGQRRVGTGSNPDSVVVLDPIENSELAVYQESSEAGVWQPVAPATPVQTAAPRASLGNLLKRVGKLLAGAERQMLQARSQARTATIGVEMEEILVQQATPLEALANDIEEALTAVNEVDRATQEHDAAIEAKALSDKAVAMRALGRELRISITRAQPPTVGRLVYLKRQGEISITRPKGREPSARRTGRPQDYLQEYVISDTTGQPLWYAHFHYPSMDTAASDFTAAHLKTREQRFDGGQYRVKAEQNSQVVIQIYRSLIDRASADALFLGL